VFYVLRLLFSVMIVCVFLHGTGQAAASTSSTEDLAKKSQNPIADMMSVPFQYNLYTHGALGNSTMSVLNIQPVIPTSLNKDWNLIARAIVPLINMPTSKGNISGTGDSTLSFFFSPKNTGATTWGGGPVFQIPTASDAALGTQTFGIGPTAVIVKMDKQWVYGALANYIFSVGNSSTGLRTNMLFVQPFINYNLPQRRGMAISFSPGITCDFTRDPGDQWTVPLGLGVSQIFKIGKQPMSFMVGAYYNIVRPVNAPEWNYRFQLTFLFPK
jgi:hypothetical protein